VCDADLGPAVADGLPGIALIHQGLAGGLVGAHHVEVAVAAALIKPVDKLAYQSGVHDFLLGGYLLGSVNAPGAVGIERQTARYPRLVAQIEEPGELGEVQVAVWCRCRDDVKRGVQAAMCHHVAQIVEVLLFRKNNVAHRIVDRLVTAFEPDRVVNAVSGSGRLEFEVRHGQLERELARIGVVCHNHNQAAVHARCRVVRYVHGQPELLSTLNVRRLQGGGVDRAAREDRGLDISLGDRRSTFLQSVGSRFILDQYQVRVVYEQPVYCAGLIGDAPKHRCDNAHVDRVNGDLAAGTF